MLQIRFLAPAVIAAQLLVLGPVARADTPGGRFGLGLVVGEPTGVSAQLKLGGPRLGTALNFAVGLDLLDDDDLYVHVDYIFLLGELTNTSTLDIPFYVGIGGFLVASDNESAGARVPFGLQLDFHRAPLHIFGEIVARLRLIDDLDVGIGGAIGFRYFF